MGINTATNANECEIVNRFLCLTERSVDGGLKTSKRVSTLKVSPY